MKIVVGGNHQGSSGRIAIRASNSAELSGVHGFETPSTPDEIRAHVKNYSSGRSDILIIKTLSFELEFIRSSRV